MPRIDGNSALPLTSSMRQLNLRTEPPINVEDRLLAQDDAIRDIQNNLSDFHEQIEAIQWNIGSSNDIAKKLTKLQVDQADLSKHVQECVGKDSHEHYHKLMNVKMEIWRGLNAELEKRDDEIERLSTRQARVLNKTQLEFQELEERTKEKLAEVQESFQRSLNWHKNQRLDATEIQSQRIEKVQLQFKKQLNQIQTQFCEQIDDLRGGVIAMLNEQTKLKKEVEQIDDLRGGLIATVNEQTKLKKEFNRTHSQLKQKISANNKDISMIAEEQEHFIAQQAKQIRVLRDEVDVLASKNTQLEAQQDELRAEQARQNAEVQKELAQIKKQFQELLQSKDGIHHIG